MNRIRKLVSDLPEFLSFTFWQYSRFNHDYSDDYNSDYRAITSRITVVSPSPLSSFVHMHSTRRFQVQRKFNYVVRLALEMQNFQNMSPVQHDS